MNVGTIQFGTPVIRGDAAPPAATQALEPAAVVRPLGELPDVQPARASLGDPRTRIREQVLAERGLNVAALMRLPPMLRIEMEAKVEGEVARRMVPKPQRLLDIRV